MGTSTLTNIGLSAMNAQSAGLQTTGHNIANASVKGYSRQDVTLATKPGQWANGAYYGRGVDVSSVTRAHDEYLTREASSMQSLASMDSTQLKQIQSLESLFQPGAQGLGTVTSNFFDSLVDLGTTPTDLSARQVVLSRADNMASRFADAGASINTLQSGITSDLTSAVDNINSLAQNIANVNKQLAVTRGAAQPPNDLLDQRDQLIAQLAAQINVSRVDNTDGTTSVFVAGGQTLVNGIGSTAMRLGQDPADPTRSAVFMGQGASQRLITEGTMGGGAVAGLLKFQNQDLVEGRNLIGRLALAVGTAINTQQQLGISMEPPTGTPPTRPFGSPFFEIAAPQVLPNANNAKGPPAGSVVVTIDPANAKSVLPSDYEFRQDPANAGAWQIKRLSDREPSWVSAPLGQPFDGMTITASNVQPGDTFLLQPVGRAASGMKSLISDPLKVAAAAPLTATMNAANTGTASVASLSVNASPLPVPGASTEIAFTDNQGSYTWTLRDISGAVIGGGPGTWTGGQPIPTPPQDFNGYTLNLNGVPKMGDKLTVDPISSTSIGTNNGNALALQSLRETQIMGTSTYNQGWTDAMSQVGVRVQTLNSASTISTAISEHAELQRSSQAGVNMDEEAARLIQYQQAYQAAAKVLTVATAIFDTLLQSTSR
jgi:flagellar hook-associated protein 1 FlgK